MSIKDRIELNKMYTFTGDKNEISQKGISLIQDYTRCLCLRNPEFQSFLPEGYDPYDYQKDRYPNLPSDWQWMWTIEKGVYRGTFPKRYSSFVYKQTTLKVPDFVLRELGNLARSYSGAANAYHFDFVDKFDWRAGHFGDGGSCFWSSRETARTVMELHGCWAIRFWQEPDRTSQTGYARAWLIPDYPQSDMITLFNGYGKTLASDPTIQISLILSKWLDYEGVQEIELRNHNDDSGILYINGGRAFTLTPKEEPKLSGKRFDLHWDTNIYMCAHCHEYIDNIDGMFSHDGCDYCENCYEELFTTCDRCGRDFRRENATDVIVNHDGDIERWCTACTRDMTISCTECGERVSKNIIIRITTNTSRPFSYYCPSCYESNVNRCSVCGSDYRLEHLTTNEDGEYLCSVCAEDAKEIEDNDDEADNQFIDIGEEEEGIEF